MSDINDETVFTTDPEQMAKMQRGSISGAAQHLVNTCFLRSSASGWWTLNLPATGGGLEGIVPVDLVDLIRNPKDAYDKYVVGAIVAQKLCLVHSEVSEAMEGHRKNLMDDKLPHRTMVEVELADAVIRICDLAGAMGLDLGGAIAEKLEFNAKRPDHKPEARAAEGGKAY